MAQCAAQPVGQPSQSTSTMPAAGRAAAASAFSTASVLRSTCAAPRGWKTAKTCHISASPRPSRRALRVDGQIPDEGAGPASATAASRPDASWTRKNSSGRTRRRRRCAPTIPRTDRRRRRRTRGQQRMDVRRIGRLEGAQRKPIRPDRRLQRAVEHAAQPDVMRSLRPFRWYRGRIAGVMAVRVPPAALEPRL